MAETGTLSGWQRFWERGGWWRAVVLVVAYLVLYELLSLLIAPLVPLVDATGAAGILVLYALPIALGCALLIGFAASVHWLPRLFRRQPIGGRGWMWIAVTAVLLFNVLRMASVDYAAAGFDVVATWLLTGLFIGFAEEVLTRGFVVDLLRRGGSSELVVAVISAGLFALLHASNLLSGQSVVATLLQLVYTFAFGICMYLALRLTRTLIAPILLHASTDPSIFLLTGYPSDGALAAVAGLGNFVVIAVGFVALFFIRGRLDAEQRPATEGAAYRTVEGDRPTA